MSMNEKIPTYLKYAFVAICVAELCAEFFDLKDLRHTLKPMLMPVLLVYLRKGTTGPLTLSFILAVFALVFSFVGDSVLMYADKDELYFMMGLGAFATAQVLYAVAFSKAVDMNSLPMPNVQKVIYAVPFIFIGLALLWMLWPGIGALKIPVTIYAALIITMAVMAVYRNGRSSTESVNQVILGASFFILSDALLAINKFHTPMQNSGLFIMMTYMLAQWNIINGLQKHFNK
jgi:uncharacterized membrane protein YhhN